MNQATEASIKSLASNIDAAYNSGDAVKMARYWVEDGVNINPFGDVFKGRANIEADLADNLNGFMKDSQHELAIDTFYPLSSTLVVADGLATISGITNFDGSKMEPLTSNFSMVCTKDDAGNWQIAQMRAYRFIPKQG